MKPMGVTTKKNINPMTTGETNFPNKRPNFIHNLFNGVNIFEFIKANTKKMNEIRDLHKRGEFYLNKVCKDCVNLIYPNNKIPEAN